MNIFDHLKNITTNKGPYLGDEGWNNWMINRYLSMDPDYCEVVNYVQKNTWQMKGECLYNLYRDLTPRKQIKAHLDYLDHRYEGSACKALRHLIRKGWH